MKYVIENKEMNDLIVSVYEATKTAHLTAIESLKMEMAATGVTYGNNGEVTGFVIPTDSHYDKDYFDKLTMSIDGQRLDVITFLSPGMNKYKTRVKPPKPLSVVAGFFLDKKFGHHTRVELEQGQVCIHTEETMTYPLKRVI